MKFKIHRSDMGQEDITGLSFSSFCSLQGRVFSFLSWKASTMAFIPTKIKATDVSSTNDIPVMIGLTMSRDEKTIPKMLTIARFPAHRKTRRNS